MLMGDQHPKSDVKFALVDQKGPLDVLLDHEQVWLDNFLLAFLAPFWQSNLVGLILLD